MLRQTLVYAMLTFFLFACAKRQEGERCALDGDCDGGNPPKELPVQVGGTISCTAQSTKPVYIDDETVGLTITASGGSGTYAIPGFVSSFSGSTTIYIGAYQNDGTGDRAVEKSVYVTDSEKRVTSCNFRFTVKPDGNSGSSGLACGITPKRPGTETDFYNPMVGESVNFKIKAAGGTPGYSFELFYPRQGEAPKPVVVGSVAGEASVLHSYSWVGYADPTVRVKDASGASVWCEIPNRYMSILPRTAPRVYASVSAATVDADGNATEARNLFRVTLSTTGFSGINPIDYKFTNNADAVFSETGVSVTQNQNWTGDSVFFVKRLDAPASHDFTIKFVAETSDGQTANIPVNIKFGDYLACFVAEPLYLFQGVEGLFTVNSYSGEAVEIAEVVNPSGVTIRKTTSGNAGVLGLTFGARGFYEVRFKAKSRIDTLKYCNGRADYVVGAYILPPPSTLTGCQVSTSLSSVSVNSPLRVDIKRIGGVVDPNGYFVTLTPNGSSTRIAGPYPNGPETSSIDLKLHEVKNYLLQASMREISTGRTVYCQTYVNVVSNPGLLAKVYNTPWRAHHAIARRGEWVYRAGSDHVVQNVNVTARRSDCALSYHYGAECEYPQVYGTKEWFGVEYTGFIKIPTAGTHAFKFLVDDGVSLEIDSDNDGVFEASEEIIKFDGLHAPQSTPVVHRYLSAGDHKIRIRYFQGPRNHVANVFFWQRPNYLGVPNGVWEVVPPGRFRQP